MVGTPIPSSARRRRKGRQQTIEDVLGKAARSREPASSPTMGGTVSTTVGGNGDDGDDSDDLPIRRVGRKGKSVTGTSPSLPPSSGHVRRGVILDSDDSADEDGGNEKGKSKVESEEEDEEDVRPAKRRRFRQPTVGSESDSESDDGFTVATPPSKQTPSRLVRMTPLNQAATRSTQRSAGRSARTARSARSAKQRHLELLRRRRMGEKVTESDLESQSDDDYDCSDGDGEHQPRKALYDKDPDLVALSDFDDEEKEEEEEGEEGEDPEEDDEESEKRREKEEKRQRKEEKGLKKEKKRLKLEAAEQERLQFAKTMQLRSRFDDDEDDGYGSEDGDDGGGDEVPDDDMDDFIDDSKTGLLGAPDGSDAEDEQAMLRREIPLQFTFQAHKPLKSHFKDAVEWLVRRRVCGASVGAGAGAGAGSSTGGAAFNDADDELYSVAWDRLDREVGGLAQSQFISSVWTPEFYGTLRARPYMDSFDIRPSRGGRSSLVDSGLEGNNICHACGRSNHPASYQVRFGGKAYNSKTLDDLKWDGSDDDESSEEDNDDDDDDNASLDMNGNAIEPTSRQWLVGAFCHSNAETAHGLLHWRHALKDWVEEKLQADHVLDDLESGSTEKGRKGKKVKKSKKEKLKPEKLREFAYKIVDSWEANGTIDSLFRDFKTMLEGAQAKSGKTLSRFGR